MNLEEEEEENLTVYIEELKSDDSSLKLNATQKVSQISKVLGPSRTRNELIPFLIEIIEECDNDDEFLINLAEQLVLLKDQIGGDEFVHLILAPLEIISSMEESQIRQKAIQSIIQLSENMNQNFFTKYFLHMIKQLATWDHFNSRISACYLLHVCYPHVVELDKQDILQLFQDLCKDDSPMVRRSAAENLGKFLEVANKNSEEILVQNWSEFLKDSFDSVKVKAIETGAQIIDKINQNIGQDQISQLLQNFQNCSWRVRYALAEAIPAFLQIMNESEKGNLLFCYKKLLQDTEQEVKSIAVLKIPDVCNLIKPIQFQQNLLPELVNLANDASYHVRSSVAQTICKIIKFLDRSQIQTEIFPIIEKLFKDDVIDVKQSLLSTFETLQQILGSQTVKDSVFPIITNVQNEKNWRARLSVVEQIPKLCQGITFDVFNSNLKTFVTGFLLDHYQAIRLKTVENYIHLSQIYGYNKMRDIIISSITDISKNSNYLFRITAIQALEILKDVLPSSDMQELFENNFMSYQNDKVPNVKFNLLKVYKQIYDKLSQQQKNKMKFVAQRLINDGDSDIAYFASQI